MYSDFLLFVEMATFGKIFSGMNLQEILEPIVDIIVSSFEMLLVPISEPFNYFCIALGFIGLFIWLNMQAKYNRKAKQEGGIM